MYKRQAYTALQIPTGFLADKLGSKKVLPVSYTHLDVYKRQTMETMGFPFVKRDEVGNVLALFPGKDDSKTIVSMVHMDTVFPFDTDLSVKRDGNILAAPGVSDNSASLACMLLLGKVFREHLPLEHPVVFVATVGEEGLGDLRGARFFCDNIENYDFDGFQIHPKNVVFLNIDGGMGHIVNSGVGSRRLRIEFSGQGGHSWGSFGNTNAIYGIGRAIANISQIQVPETPRTTYNAVSYTHLDVYKRQGSRFLWRT